MIKYNYIFALLLAVSISHISNAQSRKKGNIKKTQNTLTEKDPAQRLFNEMLPFTEKILVADSVILDKRVMLDNIPMPKNLGLMTTFGRFFNTKENPDGIVYRNEFADRCYVSMPDTAGHMQLYSIDKIGEKWDKPKLISDFNEDFTDISYPFMSDDGITLIFAGKGKKSIGGYDLFRTIFDHEEGKFMEPENMGLPYNSTGNDYVFISDDIDSLCWLLSDRNMAEGKVCLYSIVKGNVRNTYKEGEVSKEQLLRLAEISSIKDTWTLWDDKNAVNRALERKNKISSRSTEKVKNEMINFVVNDNVTYTSINDFKSAKSKQMFQKYNNIISDIVNKAQHLDNMRDKYINSSLDSKKRMHESIIKAEKELNDIRLESRKILKSIRNAENLLLTK